MKDCHEYSCRICEYAGTHFRDLKMHAWKHHNFLVHTCEYCQHISFDDTDEVTHKLLNCQLKGAFKCETCSLQFEKVRHVQLHSTIHLSMYPNRCFYCHFITKNANRCSDHQNIHTRPEAKFRCPYCAWNSCSYAIVAEHIMRSHVCEYFFKSFPSVKRRNWQ